ncbi:SixA phosphatase family protein [Myroides pelagicus]|uniref:Histidine phosphatase family protein n=1 Tax=Myroides pelagicus TaxID=270914 RepID=A0A7K1GN19_9FLAO|nr:histidine phosphatase family protein [Myroides pelagicus]MEC4114873.1 histidine phosphatase family protein [Myroides pelagicus]MTH30231.1 histidine phosphatase family protein [Myroides pelagicus]
MKTIVLIRHAKSCWNTTSDDKTRPLSNKGVRDAHLVSQELIRYLPSKYIVWSSEAKRAKETAIIFGQNMEINLDCILYKKELYVFEEQELTKVIKKCKNEHDALILFGHNDAITNFVNKFGNETYDKVPTSGSVIIQFDTDNWEEIDVGEIVLTLFPRDLKSDEHKSA